MISILKIEKLHNNFLNLFVLRNKDNCEVELSSGYKNDTSDNIKKRQSIIRHVTLQLRMTSFVSTAVDNSSCIG